jgi:hypothetical protein
MLGVEAIPALFYLLLTLYIPDTPRWYILFQNNDKRALKTLEDIYGKGLQAQSVFDEIKSTDKVIAKKKQTNQ